MYDKVVSLPPRQTYISSLPLLLEIPDFGGGAYIMLLSA